MKKNQERPTMICEFHEVCEFLTCIHRKPHRAVAWGKDGICDSHPCAERMLYDDEGLAKCVVFRPAGQKAASEPPQEMINEN